VTKRETIAMHIMSGLITRDFFDPEAAATYAVECADALVDALQVAHDEITKRDVSKGKNSSTT
jgi:hypothetical protein